MEMRLYVQGVGGVEVDEIYPDGLNCLNEVRSKVLCQERQAGWSKGL